MSARLLMLFLLCLPVLNHAQKSEQVIFHIDKKKVGDKLIGKETIQTSKRKLINRLKLEGYVGLSFTDSIQKKDNWHYFLDYQKRFKKVVLTHRGKSIPTSLVKTPDQINAFLIDLENSGFPFAEIVFTEQNITDQKLELSYQIDSGQFTSIRKIIIKSPDKFHQNTIENLIHINSGEPYNESKVQAISELFAANNFYELIRAPELLFLENEADLYLTIKKRNASIADGFIGFQQNPENQRIELTGNINLGLKNGLNRAEIIDFKWQSNANQSQNLDIFLSYPFILKLPIGVSGSVNIQKQDTSFIRNGFQGAIKYLSSFYTIGIFGQSENSFLLGNTVQDESFVSFNRNTFGVEGDYTLPSLNRYRPKLLFKIGVFGLKTDSLESANSVNNLWIDTRLIQTIKIGGPFSFENVIRVQDIRSNEQLSDNQLFYFGGLKSIRGFYELELNGNHVFSTNNALIFKPVSQLSLQLIYDYAQFHSKQFTQTNTIGFGFSIENENNTLGLVLANGMIAGNAFSLQNTKLHLGIISRF